MIERFPYGKAPFWLFALAIASSVLLVATRRQAAVDRPDLTIATFAVQHYSAYRRILPDFERQHHVKVGIELVDQRALQTRLQNAMLAHAAVPDLVEIMDGTIGFFTRGPLNDVGFVDLTERVQREGYREQMVASRFSKWESRGRLFAVPHDVHPVMLAYRADLVEKLGIDVTQLDTWEAFAAEGRKVTADVNGDGALDRYMIDLPSAGGFGLSLLLVQRGVALFDERGHVAFDEPRTVDTLLWYLHQVHGPQRISTECGWGQPLAKAMSDGVALFYLASDWRSFLIQTDVPQLAGKMKLMPLPAWEKGGRRTSTWGGTGLAITKQSAHQELAWQLAKFLYFNPSELGRRFAATGILPPFRAVWSRPEFQAPNAFFSGQPLGAEYARLAPETPTVRDSAYSSTVEAKLSEVLLRSGARFDREGERGLRESVQRDLTEAAEYVARVMERNVLGGEAEP
ncbi:MAG TPA: extracellular solute-binding protein [Polyangiaceae bacterium]|nr:extracellular solute-binding protein [Polyangiaceae bacterium]